MKSSQRPPVILTLLLALALQFASGALPIHGASTSGVLRVGMLRHFASPSEVTVSASSSFGITDSQGSRILECGVREPVRIQAAGGRMILSRSSTEPITADGPVLVSAMAAGSLISLDSPGRRHCEYRGAIEIVYKGGSMSLVNVVALEDYLLGVLPAEMPSGYPIEALKAQAVAARTYAIGVRKHAAAGFDICDRTDCQVYDGALSEKPACSRAVSETRGAIITFSGKPASVMYCADCGGKTRPYGNTHPYLRGVTEPPEIEHCAWEIKLKPADAEAKLKAAGVAAAGLTGLEVQEMDSSGRAVKIRVDGAPGVSSIPAEKLRDALGLKSLVLAIDAGADDCIIIRGKGNGHGVGMCQVGAKGLAQPPLSYTCDRILAHYFPGTSLSSAPQQPRTSPTSPTARTVPGQQQPEAPSIDIRVKTPRL